MLRRSAMGIPAPRRSASLRHFVLWGTLSVPELFPLREKGLLVPLASALFFPLLPFVS